MSEFLDARGFALPTHNAEAAKAFEQGSQSYIRWRTDAFKLLDAAIEADPAFAMPLLTKAWILQVGRSDQYRITIDSLLRAAEPNIGDSNSRESVFYRSLQAASQGKSVDAGTILEAYLAAHPTDLLAHRLAQFELFWNGRSQWMRDIAERAAPAWDVDTPDFGYFQAVRAFSNEEAGHYALAERCGRQAVEIDPEDAWGTHAVAHVLVMRGDIDEGVNWLEGLSSNWACVNQMAHHLWWHLCLFLLEQGEHDRIMELLFSRIRNPESPLVQAVPDATIDLQNVASLLLRLELRGLDVGDAWQCIADVCAERVHDHANPFTNAHDMMVLMATGQRKAADELMRSVRAFAAERADENSGSLKTAYRAVGIGVCEGIYHHRLAQHDAVIAALLPIRQDLPLIGGSHAQRDIFYQVLMDSVCKVGRRELIPLLVSDIERYGFHHVESRTLYKEALTH